MAYLGGTKAVYSASDSGKRISTTGSWGIKGWNCEDLQDIPRIEHGWPVTR